MDEPVSKAPPEAGGFREDSAAGARVLLLKAGAFLAVAIVVALLCRYTALRHWFEPAGGAIDWVRNTGVWGAVIFVLGSTLLMVFGLPRLVLCVPAGVLFGFWGGMGTSLVSTMMAYQTIFLLIRGRRNGGRATPALPRKLAWLARDPGWMGVLVARLLPIHGMAVTVALSLSKVRNGPYLLGSLIGLAPEAAPLVLLGASLNPAGRVNLLGGVVATLAFAGVAGLGILWGIRRARGRSRINST
jgi:uncharacterized membrane protein YdjX (TVP38/TMEM64 family)